MARHLSAHEGNGKCQGGGQAVARRSPERRCKSRGSVSRKENRTMSKERGLWFVIVGGLALIVILLIRSVASGPGAAGKAERNVVAGTPAAMGPVAVASMTVET